MAKKNVFRGTMMSVNRLDFGGTTDEPKARIHLRVPLDKQMILDLNLEGALNAPEIDLDEGIHLHPGPLDFGDVFKLSIVTVPDENGTQGGLITNRHGVSLVAAKCRNIKGAITLIMSVLIPLESWAEFGFLVDYVKREVEVTIWPGAKQAKLPLE